MVLASFSSAARIAVAALTSEKAGFTLNTAPAFRFSRLVAAAPRSTKL
jgi:hypothetical protein